ncbi:MAG: folylpolyglutamate synthase/dihydrofolate synthase family protein [Velocimicrobium sp.]
MNTYEEAMAYIETVSRYGSVLGLENTKELMRRLGNPQDTLSFVHVAGTNGKGSTCAYIASILKTAGYKVGRYVSPTIFAYRERIQVDGKWIFPDDFTKQLKQVKIAVEEMEKEGHAHPTQFEIETAVAFLEFKDKECDVVVLEVGLGGRLDATNVIQTTICSVMTSISMDHMAILGNSLEMITKEKAGIIKAGIPVVSHQQKQEVTKLLQKRCSEMKTTLKSVELSEAVDVSYSLEKTEFSYVCKEFGAKMRVETKMLAKNQVLNAMTAIETTAKLKKIGYHITRDDVIKGVKDTCWDGRFSIVHQCPYVIVDGAHNEEAAISLRQSTKLYFNDKPIVRIIGVFRDKEYEKILANTVCKEDIVIAIRPDCERGLEAAILKECAENYCNQVYQETSVAKALKLALTLTDYEDVILVYGSLSILHEVYAFFKNRKAK